MVEAGYKDVDVFSELLQRLSGDFGLVQGFGGNASVKTPSRMLIKASGRRMGSVAEPGFFHEVSLDRGRPLDNLPNQSTRPSIEVFLHALLKETYVVHLHSTRAVAISMVAAGDSALRLELRRANVAYLDYLRPGRELARGIKLALEGGVFHSFLLGNHGTLFCSDSVDELEARIMSFEKFARESLPYQGNATISPSKPAASISPAESDHAVWHALHNWRVSPDHCVFLGPEPSRETLVTLSSAQESDDLFRAFSTPTGNLDVKSEQLAWFYNLTQLLPRQVLSTLEMDEALYLCEWEAERLRVQQT